MFPSYEKWVFLTTFLFLSGAFFIMTRLNALNISCAQKFRVKDSFLSRLHRFVINKEYIIYPKKLIMLTLLRHNTAHASFFFFAWSTIGVICFQFFPRICSVL